MIIKKADQLEEMLAAFITNPNDIFTTEYRNDNPIYIRFYRTLITILCGKDSLNPRCSIFLIAITNSISKSKVTEG